MGWAPPHHTHRSKGNSWWLLKINRVVKHKNNFFSVSTPMRLPNAKCVKMPHALPVARIRGTLEQMAGLL